MASVRSGPPAPEGKLPVKTGACFAVGELIDYARGQIDVEARQRIEKHLKSAACGYCRSWIEGAKTLAVPGDPPAAKKPGGKWQRAVAFRDLEERLRALAE